VDALPSFLCLLWQMLCRRRCVAVIVLGGCLAVLVVLVGWMFCHLCWVVDLCTLDDVVSFSRFRGVVLS
jgi:hypothetical protein